MTDAATSQGEFAKRIGLDGSKLSKSLSGVRRFSLTDLSSIAQEFNVSVDWLLTGEESPLALAARKAPAGSVKEAIELAACLTSLRSDLAALGYQQEWRPLRQSVRFGGRLVDQGEALAEAALAQVTDAGLTVAKDGLFTVVEQVFGADVVVAPLGSGMDGIAASTPEAKMIVLAPTRVPTRQRFTLAHELCHLLASDDQGLHVDEDIYSADSRRGDSEMRANAFAAAFLMPRRVILDRACPPFSEHDFCVLASDLKVSPAALAYRLCDLEMIDADTRDHWRTVTGQRAANIAGQGKQFAEAIARSDAQRRPASLVRDSYQAYTDGNATLRTYAALIGEDVESLKRSLDTIAEVPELIA